ncbi:TolC family protein [Brumimicrobium aurantiacum]|uniref:TolC family protein n=1 Tax=Brumimicrobium aurantiacum TaxID=1737063 RepID=A0A3E1F0P1_9FLAO|nr:TolC family protein [Brumimicrobium aurantiacum]RFC55303.1 TolC family protein [Brumimicrobium aurantiacum]
MIRKLIKVSLLFSVVFYAKNGLSQDTLIFNKAEAETVFLKNNLVILAENLSISKAEAKVIQAKVWPNPTFTLDQINLWRPKNPTSEPIPPIFGNYNNQQVGISIEQLILTAGKRKKLVALEKVGLNQSIHYFEEVLRGLKIEFRTLLNELIFYQNQTEIYENQLASINQLLDSYKNQVESGFLNKGEYIRLKAVSLELVNNLNEIESNLNKVKLNLKNLMNLPPSSHFELKLEFDKEQRNPILNLDIEALIDSAHQNRPEYQISKLQEDYTQKHLAVERAEKVPNLTLIGSYDRGGSIYTDFIGFGVALDVPVFNRNKGNIRIAELNIEEAKFNHELVSSVIEKEVNSALFNYRKSLKMIQQIDEGYEIELDQTLKSYTSNFQNRNIDILQYLDFFEAYLENKNIILEATLKLKNRAEELNYAVGKDIIK